MRSGPSPPAISSPVAIGADLGGTKMLVGVVAEGPKVLHRVEEVSLGRSTDEVLDTMELELRRALEACPEARAAGLGIPCTIDYARGLAISAVNLPIVDVPVRDIMSERLGIEIVVDNDANAAALAEHRWGAARGAKNAVLLTIGTGIGGGLIIDGNLYRGSTGAGAELGHMVIDAEGPPCQGNCPNNGCAEAVASGTALGREASAAAEQHPDSALGRLLESGEEVTGRAATVAAIAGDEVAAGVIELIGRRLGAFASGLANVFEPEVIVSAAGCTGSTGGAGSTDYSADDTSKFTQTWPKSYSGTSCAEWNSQMTPEQQFAASADMLAGARNKGDGGTGLPDDSLIDQFLGGVTTACVEPTATVAEIGAMLYLTERESFRP